MRINRIVITLTIGATGYREQKSRGYEIRQLDSRMVVAVTKQRYLHDVGKGVSGFSKLLREDPMRHTHILGLGTAVADDEAGATRSC